MLYIHKGKGRLDRKITDLLEEGRFWREIIAGVKTAAACLGELITKVVMEAKQRQPV